MYRSSHDRVCWQLKHSFCLLSTGDGAVEAFVPVPSQEHPLGAQLKAPSLLVTGGRTAAIKPASVCAGQSEKIMDILKIFTDSLSRERTFQLNSLVGVCKLKRPVTRSTLTCANGSFVTFTPSSTAPLGPEAPWQPVLTDVHETW